MRLKGKRTATLVALGLLQSLMVVGCGSSSKGSTTTVVTTRQQTTHPVAIPASSPQIPPRDVAHYATYGYSAFSKGAGEDQGRKTDLLPSGTTVGANTARLASFFSISDIHITDKESPAEAAQFGWQAPYNAGGLNSSAFSPVMLSTTQVLDATVRTINALHRQSPLDFGMSLGDVGNSSQANEVQWFLDVMDGKYIVPSSGDHKGASTIDYQKPFQAAGIDHTLPWFACIGNHDQYFMGIGQVTDKVRSAQVGSTVLNMGTNILATNASAGNGMYVGLIDGTTPFGDVIKGGPTASFTTAPTVVADPARLSLTTDTSSTANYIAKFRASTSLPTYHGFGEVKSGSLAACYSFKPKTGLPLKVIVLDDTCKSTSASGDPMFWGGGWVDAERMTWLKGELQAGQDAGELMVIMCHIPMNPQKDLFDTTVAPQFSPNSPNSETAVITELHKYPNLLMVIAGHRHLNTVTPQPSADPTHPENGFWEVETPSLRDFPRALRTFELRRNSDNTVSILTTDVEPAVEAGSVAEKSLGYSIGAFRTFGLGTPTDTTSHMYNAELVKPLTAAMQTKIATLGTVLTTAKAK